MIKNFFYKLLQLIDDGRFLIKPMKWLYYFKAVILFVVPVYILYGIISDSPRFIFNEIVTDTTWAKILSYIFAIVFILFLFFLAYVNFLFWTNRAKKLETIVRRGDSIVAIPLISDNIKNNGEILAILISVTVVVWSVLILLFVLLSFEGDLYKYALERVLKSSITYSLAAIVVSFVIILLAHLFAEGLRMFAQMCNDLRDVADIHRAATMSNNDNIVTEETQINNPIFDQQS